MFVSCTYILLLCSRFNLLFFFFFFSSRRRHTRYIGDWSSDVCSSDLARSQLGTVGSGNHYVDVFADEADRVWVGVHFGSRGFGFGVAHGFLALGQNRAWGERVPERETLLDIAKPVGEAYWQLMNLAGRYAYAGREWVARKVVALLGGRELELVHNHHNFAWQEQHGGERC